MDDLTPSMGVESPRSSDTLGEHVPTVALVAAGYVLVAVVTAAATLLPRVASGAVGAPSPADPVALAAGRVGAAVAPLVLALSLVGLDLVVVRLVSGPGETTWRTGLGWVGVATPVVALAAAPLVGVVPSAGLLRSRPALAVVGVGVALSLVPAAVAAVGGAYPPLALRDGLSVRGALARGWTVLRDGGPAALSPPLSLLVGWGVGVVVVGLSGVVLAFALGLLAVGVGFFLLPLVPLVALLGLVVAAFGHVRYRLRTATVYGRR